MGIGLLAGLVPLSSAQAKGSSAAPVVSDKPADFTPDVRDGDVQSIAQVGGTIVLGGGFSRVSNSGSDTELSRTNLLAFDATSGTINTTFPQTDGPVWSVIPAGDGASVYVAGRFSSIGGVARKNVARVRVSDGAVDTRFNVGAISGLVKDLRLADGRLWLAGGFSGVSGNSQAALATVDPSTGAFDAFMGLPIAGTHNGGGTNLFKMDVTPDGRRLVAIGNIATVDGQRRDQILMLDLTGASATLGTFYTTFFETRCASVFDSYMRDLDIAPDGSYFVVSTTGAGRGPDAACDTTSRFEIDGNATSAPSWVDTTGGDTTYAVEITPEDVVYVGGHHRWQNNSFGSDTPGQGAVGRPGIAALWGVNGLPLSWNPTRARGVGVFDFLYTDQGLWVASDTDRIGNFDYHGKIALMPARSTGVAAEQSSELPNDIYTAGKVGSASDPSILYRVNAGGQTLQAASGPDWAADTNASPNPFHNQVGQRASYGTVPNVDATVPAGTPPAVFDTELWDAGDNSEQSWDFPVEAGVDVAVRLYFANRCTCTNDPGERSFNVDVEGARVLDNFDIAASAGDQTGTMREFPATSDGNIDIDFAHVVENPLVNAIEIVRTDLPPMTADTDESLVQRSYRDGAVGSTSIVQNTGIDWNKTRGAFMLNGKVYYGTADGALERRSFNGSFFGSAVAVDTQDDITPLEDWRNDVRGSRAMAYDFGRVYFTQAGSDQLFYRYLAAESDVVGAKRYVASGRLPDLDFSSVRGMFITGDALYFANAEGQLFHADWAQGPQSGAPVAGTVTQVSGPGIDTQTWNARSMFVFQDASGRGTGGGPVVADPPTSAFDVSCSGLTCDFDGSASTAPNGQVDTYQWNFGDGGSDTGVRRSHTYSEGGQWTATLTVTSNGASDSSSRTFTVAAAPAPGEETVAFVDSSSTAGNRRNHTATIPATTRPGDTLVAFYTVNSPDTAITDPAGWTRLQSVDGNRVQGVAWTRQATAADAGRTITVGTEGFVKSALSLVVYRGVDGPSSAGASAVRLENPSGTQHTTPLVDATVPGSWLVSYWSEKSASSPSWTLPDSVDLHESPSSSGGGAISARLADSRGPVATGAVGGIEATTSTTVARAVMFSVVVQPQAAVANRAPVAAFASSCPSLRCTFDASGSSDADGDALTYAWDFGNGNTATGISPEHTYSAGGSQSVTLTVSDGSATDEVTRQVSPVEVAQAADVTFVNSASSGGNRVNHRVTVPADAEAGDTLVAFYTVNSPDTAITDPAGWTRIQSVDGNRVQGVAWTRQATAADAGRRIVVQTDGYAKSALSVAVYRGVDGSSTVGASAVELENPSGTRHVTPTVDVAVPGSWLVSYWSEKSASSPTWTLPTSVDSREEPSSAGGGAISARLGDSGRPVDTGSAGGLEATTSTTVARAVMFSVVVEPAR